jgi:hypothetical protein
MLSAKRNNIISDSTECYSRLQTLRLDNIQLRGVMLSPCIDCSLVGINSLTFVHYDHQILRTQAQI